jgi:Type IV secretion-system coupling protein DNA-binding domain
MTIPPAADGRAAGRPAGRDEVRVTLLEGITVQPARQAAVPAADPRIPELHGPSGNIYLNRDTLSRHVLFLGGIGTGKTNAMMQLVDALRRKAGRDDAFVIFDTKGDFLREFYRPGDAVLSSTPQETPGGVIWNLFCDLLGDDPSDRSDQIYEITSTVFSEEMSRASDNYFFAAAARDVFAAVVEAMCREGGSYSNEDLRSRLEMPAFDMLELLQGHPGLEGSARYLEGERTPDSVLAFLQQTLNKSFSGVFRRAGGFSVREFVRAKRGRALFIEYDIAMGSRLSPIYRVLMDMAIKEALGLGRGGPAGDVFFVLDEFALLPELAHISEGINFGRGLGLKFLVGTQNVNQVLRAYGSGIGESILSGFGTVLAFRLMDSVSRQLVRDRFGTNRKQITTFNPVRSEGVQQLVVEGNVIEDWVLSGLTRGQCIVSLPEGQPFAFSLHPFQRSGA